MRFDSAAPEILVGPARRPRAGRRALLLAVFLLLSLWPTLAGSANPQVPLGGSNTFPSVSGSTYPGATWTWQILSGGSAIATNVSAGGWSVSYNGTQFTVGAPSIATVATGYQVNYNQGGGGPYATFDVVASLPPALSSVTLAPPAVVGGSTGGTQSTGTVTLTSAAPAGGITVALSSSNANAATVPATAFVQAGSSTATFAVTSSAVAAQTSVTVSALYGGVTKTATLTVQPWMSGLGVSSSTVTGGSTVTGTVSLNAAAPAGGLTVALNSSNQAAATVPATVTVSAGSSSATFTVTGQTVTASASTTITATYGPQSLTTSVTAQPVLGSLTLSQSTVTGGNPVTGTVTLNSPAPSGGLAVPLSSQNGAATVPAGVTVPYQATSANFTVTTTAVTSQTTGTVTAAYGGVSRTAGLTVNPLQVTLALSPSQVVGGSPSTGTVTLNGPAPAGGVVVTLSSNNAVASVPASVTVAAGATAQTFTVTTTAVGAISYPAVTASYGGLNSAQTLTVTPLLKQLTLSASSVVGGGSNPTGTVTLYGPAPAAVTVTLSSNSGAASVPASVTVAANATTATFTVTTAAVATSAAATVTASYAGASAPATLTVLPLLQSLSLNPSSVYGGGTSTGTVTLNAPAPTGGTAVTLGNDNAAVATVPAGVTVPVGSTSATFTVTTTAVSAAATAHVSASCALATLTQALTVTPLLSGVSVSPLTVLANGTATGTVTLSGPAPSNITVTLASGTPGAATVPASVAVSAGGRSAAFTVTAQGVTVSSTTVLSASYGGVTVTAPYPLTVVPLLSAVSVSPTTVVGGDPATATVSFTLAAPAGVSISLNSSNAAAASVPATAGPSTGASSVSAAVTTHAVATPTPVTLTASYGGVSKTVVLTVNPVPTVTGVGVDPQEMFSNPTAVYSGGAEIGGPSSTGTVTLSGVAPAAGAVVSLSGSSGSAGVPASVTVLGGHTSATFTIPVYAVAADTPVTVSAAYNGTSASTTLHLDRPRLTSLSFNVSTTGGGSGIIGTVTLNGAAPSPNGLAVGLACSPANGASLPASVTVPAGASSVTFSVLTSTVNEATTLTFTAANTANPTDPVLTTTVGLLEATLHDVDLYMPRTIHLGWYLSSVGNFLITRDNGDGAGPHTLVSTLGNTATAYDDVFNWTGGQPYVYSIYDNNTPASPVLLSTEQVIPYWVAPAQDQAVDSRLDPRYSAATLLDHPFGATAYNGGLFAGYDTDPSKVGRSFAQFNLNAYPGGGVFRTGKLNLYFVTADPALGPVSIPVGAQALGGGAWSAPALTWDGAQAAFPGLSPAAAPATVTIHFDPTVASALTAAPAGGQVALSWAPPAGGAPAGYTVRYGTASGSYTSTVTGVTGTSTTVTGLTNGTAYYFAVAPVTVVNGTSVTGANSAEVSCTPPSAAGAATAPMTGYWCTWDLRSDILAALLNAGSTLLNVGWASTNEAAPGWAYFAKTEYDPALGPSVMHAWSVPTLINVVLPASVSVGGGPASAPGTVNVNAIGLTGSAQVSLTSSSPAVTFAPASNVSVSNGGQSAVITVTGLGRQFSLNVGTAAQGANVTITAAMGGITRTAAIAVTP